jgi:hypothetical protein
MNGAVRSRAGWKALCRDSLKHCSDGQEIHAPAAVRGVVCDVCSRSSRKESVNKVRHKCMDERPKPVGEQRGAVQK